MTPPVSTRLAAALAISALLLVVGCAGGGGGTSKAESVLRERMSDPAVAGYVFAIAADTPSPVERAILLESLAADDYGTSLAAAQALEECDDPACIEGMRQAYETKRGAIKLHAALVLARNGDDAARAWLLEESGGGGRLNAEVFTLLADAGEQESLQATLKTFLDSDDGPTRDEAYAVLGEIRQPWAKEMLLAGLKKEFGEQRLQPIVSLGRCGDPAVAARIAPFVNTQGLVFASLEALGELGNADIADSVEAMLDHDEALVRVYAGTALWRLGDGAAAVATLDPLIEDEDPLVRRNLAEQLEPVDDMQATAMLLRLAKDEDSEVKIAAIRSLDTRSGPDVDAALIEAAGDADYQVASAALVALGKTGGAAAVDSLMPLLDNENQYVAAAAAHAVLAIRGRTGGDTG